MSENDEFKVAREAEQEMQKLFAQLLLDPLKREVRAIYEEKIKEEIISQWQIQREDLEDLLKKRLNDLHSDFKGALEKWDGAASLQRTFNDSLARVESTQAALGLAITQAESSVLSKADELNQSVQALTTQADNLKIQLDSIQAEVSELKVESTSFATSISGVTLIGKDIETIKERCEMNTLTESGLKQTLNSFQTEVERTLKLHVWSAVALIIILATAAILLIHHFG
jgi:uncharacterized coiled-coil DUF342 family protein